MHWGVWYMCRGDVFLTLSTDSYVGLSTIYHATMIAASTEQNAATILNRKPPVREILSMVLLCMIWCRRHTLVNCRYRKCRKQGIQEQGNEGKRTEGQNKQQIGNRHDCVEKPATRNLPNVGELHRKCGKRQRIQRV